MDYFQAGVLFHATPFLDLGASYRGEYQLDFEQAFAIHGDIGPPGGPPAVADAFFALDSAALDLFQPAQWSLGFALQLTRRVLVAGDLTYSRWSTFENPSARIHIGWKPFSSPLKRMPSSAFATASGSAVPAFVMACASISTIIDMRSTG